MAVVVEAENRSKGLVIEAQGDLESAKLLNEAAENMSGNLTSVTLQGWEVLQQLSMNGCHSIVVPHDILSRFRVDNTPVQPQQTSKQPTPFED